MTNPPRARFALRRIWLTVHRWLGLSLGAALAVIGLTGSVNIFYVEIDEVLNPALVVSDARGEHRSLDDMLAAVREAHAGRTDAWHLLLPRHRKAMLIALYINPAEKTGEFYAPLMVSVDPYTARVAASRFWGETVVTWILDLHTTLLLQETGWDLVGILGICLLLSLAMGLYLWWPTRRQFVQALTIRRGSKGMGLIFDLHRVTGAYALLVLMAIAFSGVYFVYGHWIEPVVETFSPLEHRPFHTPPGLASDGAAGAVPLSIEAAFPAAARRFPAAELKWVVTPEGPEGVYLFRMRQPGEANRSWPSTLVWVDQYSGEILAVRDPADFSAGERLLNLMWPLHNGEALGMVGRILNCAVGFVPSILFITGLVIWQNKRKRPWRVGSR